MLLSAVTTATTTTEGRQQQGASQPLLVSNGLRLDSQRVEARAIERKREPANYDLIISIIICQTCSITNTYKCVSYTHTHFDSEAVALTFT